MRTPTARSFAVFAAQDDKKGARHHIMTPSRLNFRLDAQATGSRARAATFRTLHNEVQTPLFMPVGTQATVKAQLTADARRRRLADSAREHLSSAAAAGRGSFPAHRRHPRFHELEALRADGLGRLPDFLAAAFALDERGGRGLSKLPRRTDHSAQSGAQHRDAEGDRQRHHDGARSMHRLDRR